MAEVARVGESFPSREDCVLGPLLERRAEETPDAAYVAFPSGGTLTYRGALQEARRTAAALQALGVQQDDRVLVWLPNGLDILRTWFGANLLGATYVPVNTAYRGRLLEHVVRNSDARVAVVHPKLAERLRDIDLGSLESVVVMEDAPDIELPVEVLGRAALDGDPDAFRPPPRPVEPWDTQCIIYTSGTTGPSKGVLSSYLHQYLSGTEGSAPLKSSDRVMLGLPLFHAGGTLTTYGVLALGASLTMVEAFDTSAFWDVVRRTGATVCTLVGAMATFLLKQPATEADVDNPLRAVWIIPFTEDALEFGRRFGVEVYTSYNMTETSAPLNSDPNPTAIGSCGRVRRGVEARVVDDVDREVPVGQVGELVLRTDLPWAMSHGYNGMPEATAAAWRNGWFHTGDAFRRDAEGNYYFVDRKKDAIRRRGENVSSFEVEAELLAHPAVREAAVVPVPSEYGEDEILAVVAPVEGQEVDPAALTEHLARRMAHFMVPRYVRVLDELPRTPTSKVEKYRLREQGVTPDTWDAVAAGAAARRESLG